MRVSILHAVVSYDIQVAPSSSMNRKPESLKAYFPAQKYDTLDRKATLLSASSVQMYWARQRKRKFISIFLSVQDACGCDVSGRRVIFKTK
jgi:hypothetical protein